MNDYPPTMASAEELYQDSGSSMPEYSDEIRRMIDIQIGNDIKKLSLTEDMLQNALDEKARIEQEVNFIDLFLPRSHTFILALDL